MASRTLTFDITTQDAQTVAALRRIQRELAQTGTSAEKTAAKGVAGSNALRTAFGAVAVAAAGRFAIDEANQSQQTEARTAAVIKSTGNAAGVTAKQQDALVQSLSKMAAVDDEVIAGGANILRTFKAIQGPEAFAGALQASLDLSAALGTDLQSASLQVGKALQDPVRGLTALRRAGVSFSEQQRQQIKDMVDAGNTAGAQKMILAELKTEFGGSAAAMATSSARLKVALANTAESAGKVLTPALSLVASGGEQVAGAFDQIPGPLQTGVAAMGALAFASNALSSRLGPGGLGGALTSNVSGLGKLNTALLVAGTGITAYGITLQALKNNAAFKGDASALATDLEDLGKGTASVDDIFQHFGGSLQSFAGRFQSVDDSLPRQLIQPGFTSDAQNARQDIKALDEALAALASSDPEAAQRAVGALTAALHEQGQSVGQVVRLLPKYGEALDRANRSNHRGAEGAKDQAAATADLATRLRALGDATAEGGQKEFDAQQALTASNESLSTARSDLSEATEAAKGNSDEYRAAVKQEQSDLKDLADAETEVTDRKEDARQAQLGVTEAIKDAVQHEKDLQRAALDAADAQLQAQDALLRAEEEAKRKGADPRASALDKKEAADAALIAQHKAQEATQDAGKAAAESAAYTIDGDKAVVAAKQKVVDANTAIREAEQKVKDKQAEVAADGQEKSKILVEAAGKVHQAQERVNLALLDQAAKIRDVVTAQFGAVAGLDAYRVALAKIGDTLDPSSPLAQQVAAFLAQIQKAMMLDVGVIPTLPSSVTGIGIEGTGGGHPLPAQPTRSRRNLGSGASGNIIINQIHTGTPRQVGRASSKAARRELDSMFRGGR